MYFIGFGAPPSPAGFPPMAGGPPTSQGYNQAPPNSYGGSYPPQNFNQGYQGNQMRPQGMEPPAQKKLDPDQMPSPVSYSFKRKYMYMKACVSCS